MNDQTTKKEINRRSFLRSTAAASAGLAFAPMISSRAASGKPDDINVALLGAGAEGKVLMEAILKMKDPALFRLSLLSQK